MTRPLPARGAFPYPHRTVAETMRAGATLADLIALSRTRALTDAESLRLERLLRDEGRATIRQSGIGPSCNARAYSTAHLDNASVRQADPRFARAGHRPSANHQNAARSAQMERP